MIRAETNFKAMLFQYWLLAFSNFFSRRHCVATPLWSQSHEFKRPEGCLTCDHVAPMLDTSPQWPRLLGQKNDHNEPGFIETLDSALDLGHNPIQCLRSNIRTASRVKIRSLTLSALGALPSIMAWG